MLRAHIDVAMDGPRDRNIFGAFALMISDDIVRASSSRAPEAGPAASALALLAHKPGLSIRMLAIGVGLSHAGTVRLVDRLVSEGLIERREHSTDGRARSLYLTPTGKVASDEVLASRDQVIAEGQRGRRRAARLGIDVLIYEMDPMGGERFLMALH